MKRREFLGVLSTAAAVLGLSRPSVKTSQSKVKIDRIDLFPMRYPMTGYFKFFTGPHGSAGRAAVIVKITTDDGTVGWGQCVPIAKWSYETLETATVVLREYFAPVLIGHDPTDIRGAHAVMDRALAPGFTTGMPISRTGIDLALHDLTGRLLGKSLAQMWGKPKDGPITLSWTVNVKSLDDIGSVMDLGKKRGYLHFNIKVAPDPEFDLALAKEVRRLSQDSFLWADANGGYDTETALKAAPQFLTADVLKKPPRIENGMAQIPEGPGLGIEVDEHKVIELMKRSGGQKWSIS